MSIIKLIILEEHFEAYFIWHAAIQKKIIPSSNNVLLHIDQHADMDLNVLRTSLKPVEDNLQVLYDFTYSQLTISNFIIPAIYQGIFSRVYWLNHRFGVETVNNEFFIYPSNENKKIFSLKKKEDKNQELPKDSRSFFYEIINVFDTDIQKESLILDIDIDYFSCNKNPMPYHELEVSKAEYDNFINNKYHFLKLKTWQNVYAKNINNRYFLVFNDFDYPLKFGLLATNEIVLKRINLIIDFLVSNSINPLIISITRSRYSNYTPSDQWQFIEENLILNLKKIYPEIQIQPISEYTNI